MAEQIEQILKLNMDEYVVENQKAIAKALDEWFGRNRRNRSFSTSTSSSINSGKRLDCVKI